MDEAEANARPPIKDPLISLEQYGQSVTFVKECGKGAIVDDGIFTKDNARIRACIEEKVLQP